MPTHKIDDLLNEGHRRFTPLQRLLKSSANQRQWTQALRALLEAPLCHEVEISKVDGKTAWITCSSAAAATRLRFLMPELTPQLQALQSFSHIADFKIKVSNFKPEPSR